MKLIFALILLVGIMAWFLMPSQSQNSTSSNQSSVQTNNTTSSPTSTGKAIWDGKLTYDMHSIETLNEQPHSELSAEEAALKCMFYGSFIPFAPFSLTKMQEVRTDYNAQKIIQQFYTNKNGSKLTPKEVQQKKSRLEESFEKKRESENITFTVITSDVNETNATVIVAEFHEALPNSKVFGYDKSGKLIEKFPDRKYFGYDRFGYILKLIKDKKGWVMKGIYSGQVFTIQGIGKCDAFGMLSDGTIAKVTTIKPQKEVDISDKHMTVYDLLEQVK